MALAWPSIRPSLSCRRACYGTCLVGLPAFDTIVFWIAVHLESRSQRPGLPSHFANPHTASVGVVTWLCRRLESGSLSSSSSAVALFTARPSNDAPPELPLHLSRASHNCVVADWASLRTRRVPLCDYLQFLRVSASWSSYAASDQSFRQCSCLERRLTERSSSRRTSAILLRLDGHRLAFTAARCYIFQPFTLPLLFRSPALCQLRANPANSCVSIFAWSTTETTERAQ